MLDEMTEKLLSFLYSLNSTGSFELIELKDIESNLKVKNITKSKIISSLNYLRDKEYIKLRYAEDDEICYAILTNANIYLESLNQTKNIEKRNNTKFILRLFLNFISAFLGAFVAVMIVHYFL